MDNIYLTKILKSHYCQVVFVLALVGSYFLIPSRVFSGVYLALAVLFMVVFSLIVTCFVRNIKEKVKSKRQHGVSVFGIIASAIGFSAFQVCGVGAPVCGASLGIVLISSILPSFFINFLMNYSDLVLASMILIQVAALAYMGCLKKAEA